ncbi:hypothetical protein SAL_2304 [Streptococcus agalactiae 515]|nr:hypothetical protein SAL_2304 [Streptococcus agalactiae 515]
MHINLPSHSLQTNALEIVI